MRALRKGIFSILAVLLVMGEQLSVNAAQTREPDPAVPLMITAIDFGEEGWGDGTMIESNGECLLMDTFMPDCEDALKEFLLDNGYTEFAIYLSHYHADHFGGMVSGYGPRNPGPGQRTECPFNRS